MYSTHISKKKRTVSLLTAVLMVLTMSAASLPQEAWATVGETFTVGEIEYKVTAESPDSPTVEVSGKQDTNISGDVAIPDTVDYSGTTYTVSSIGNNAFNGCSGLSSVTIGNGVSSIGMNAFLNCTSLTSVIIPDNVKSIGGEAFSGCSGLSSVTIGNGVKSIGNNAFNGCSRLAAIDVAPGNTAYTTVDGVLFNNTKTNLVCYPAGKSAASYEIPGSVTSIGMNAFSSCYGLTSVTIPDSVSSIGMNAFVGCYGLTSVTIPDSVSSIGDSAFVGCSSLLSVIIPDGVNSIEDGTFSGCSSLTSVIIPDSVSSIGDGAFNTCSGLKSVTIPDSVSSIGRNAFLNCTSLTSVIIPGSVNSIGMNAFSGCSSLTSVFVLFDSDPKDGTINSAITGAITGGNPKFYRSKRQFGSTDDVTLSLVQGSTCDLVKEMDITDTVYEGTSGGSPATGITLPFTLSGNTSAGTTIDAAGVLHTASDETGALTIDAGGRKAAVTVKPAYVPPAVYYDLTAEDLAFPDLQYGDSPSPCR